jgi:hypothetical protein
MNSISKPIHTKIRLFIHCNTKHKIQNQGNMLKDDEVCKLLYKNRVYESNM